MSSQKKNFVLASSIYNQSKQKWVNIDIKTLPITGDGDGISIGD